MPRGGPPPGPARGIRVKGRSRAVTSRVCEAHPLGPSASRLVFYTPYWERGVGFEESRAEAASAVVRGCPGVLSVRGYSGCGSRHDEGDERRADGLARPG